MEESIQKIKDIIKTEGSDAALNHIMTNTVLLQQAPYLLVKVLEGNNLNITEKMAVTSEEYDYIVQCHMDFINTLYRKKVAGRGRKPKQNWAEGEE